MKSNVLYRPIQVNKAYEKIIALSTDEINTDCLANGSLLYLMDTDKYMVWDEENKKFLNYVLPSGEGGGIAGYTEYPVAMKMSDAGSVYKFPDGVDAESYFKTFAPYILAHEEDGSMKVSYIIYPDGTFDSFSSYTVQNVIAVSGVQAFIGEVRFPKDNTNNTITLAYIGRELLVAKAPNGRTEDYAFIAPAGNGNNSWKSISTFPTFDGVSFDDEIMQQIVTAMKQLAEATPNAAVTKYMPLSEYMQTLAQQIINTQQQHMIDSSRGYASILNNTTSLAPYTNNSEDAPFGSFKHQEVDFDGNKIYDFTFIFGKTKAFIQCTCYTADVLPMS